MMSPSLVMWREMIFQRQFQRPGESNREAILSDVTSLSLKLLLMDLNGSFSWLPWKPQTSEGCLVAWVK